MEDIAPELINAVTQEFHSAYENSGKIKLLLEKIRKETATYREAQEYSQEVSHLIGTAYEKHVSSAALPDGRMYYNIASRLIPATLDENYSLVVDYAAKVQRSLNERAGIGIKPQIPAKNQDRVDGLVNLASSAERYDDVSDQLLSAVENFSQNVVDESVKANADFHYSAGFRPKIIRKAERKCCEWCAQLAGVYDYPVPREIYQRHERCRCTVEYDPGDGRLQDTHTKQWTEPENSDILTKRQVTGLRSGGVTVKDISTHALERIQERNVPIEAVKDAIENPLSISPVKYDEQGRPSIKIIGSKATISVNPNTGVITTAYPTHSKTAKRLKEGK